MPFCQTTQRPGRFYQQANIAALKEGWEPDYFQVDAPELATIFFTLKMDWSEGIESSGKFVVSSLSIVGQHQSDYGEWWRAIAAAAIRCHDQKKWQADRDADRASHEARKRERAETPAPTIAQELETILCRLIRREHPEE